MEYIPTTSDAIANLHKYYYYYRKHGPTAHNHQPQRQDRPVPHSGGPQHTSQNSPWKRIRRVLARILAVLLALLLIIAVLSWIIENNKLQNYPAISAGQTIEVQVKQPANVTQSTRVTVQFIDAGGKSYTSTYHLHGNAFILKGEVLHLIGSPAHFWLAGVLIASHNINSSSSDSERSVDPTSGSVLPSFLLSSTPCTVNIGPIRDTQMHTYIILIAPDSMLKNSCSLQKG